ncbi:MAG: ATP phosphoribosyltransferase regulatory subunit, partial [Actinomycetota bacterium]|nr:ATP phosphoribosyltransferase regulatory subunit [Actinomycetota bacterium]
MERIETSPARGMKDYLPAEAALRDWMLEVILETYTSRGFQRIETPALENLERLIGSGGGENEKLIFKVLKRGEKLELSGADENALADLGLRFDLTVPLARYWAHNQPKLPPVFRAIQIGPVWRAERPQRGRFRQFMQCDIDIVGEPSVLAEMELIAVSVEVARKLGVKAPVLRFNDRRFLDAVLGWAGVPADAGGAVLVALDKLDKIGQEGVLAEIGRLELEGSVTGRLARFLA